MSSSSPSAFVPLGAIRRESETAPAHETVRLRISGMHCASCVSRVEQAMAGVPGVLAARVNLATQRAEADVVAAAEARPGDGAADSLTRRLVAAVRDAGYDAYPITTVGVDDREKREREREERTAQRRFALAAACAVLVFVLAHVTLLAPGLLPGTPWQQAFMQFVFALPVQFVAGWPFLRGLARGVLKRAPDMDTLVGLGTLTAFTYSTVALFTGLEVPLHGAHGAATVPDVYFDTSTTIVALILLGRLLEARARTSTSRAMRTLLEVRPRSAIRVRGKLEESVPLDRIVPGDVLLVRPGERVPVDGVVLAGRSAVNRSLVTGESVPVPVEPGDRVIGGTLNGMGAFHMRAERVGADSLLLQVVAMVERAQTSKASVQHLVDRVAAVFVPVVVGVGLVTFAVWWFAGAGFTGSVLKLVAVWIVACPCAMGLATPTALVTATGRGAELGLLARDAGAIERAERLDSVVFDKTGTLTLGAPQLTDVVVAPGADEARLLSAAITAESRSEHPLALAIVRGARARGVEPRGIEDFGGSPGRGAYALAGGRAIAVGSTAMLAEFGASDAPLATERERLAAAGRSVVAVAEAGEFLGLLGLSDAARPEAAQVVGALRQRGLQVWMITGDNAATAAAVAAQVGIGPEYVLSGVMPNEKSARVERLQREGRRVAMVGDGLNDAPALAQSDVGLAMASGTDVAMEASAFTLLRGDLTAVPDALRLARRTMQVIRQNLFWAFAYNVVLIPVAAGVLVPLLSRGGAVGPILGWEGTLHPMLASFAMALSSVSVVMSSLRLRSFR